MVTVCYHLLLLLFSEAEHKVGRKAVSISANGLIEGLGGNTVSFCKVAIYDYLLAANQQDSLLDLADFDQRLRLRHSASLCTPEVVADCDRLVNPSSDPNAPAQPRRARNSLSFLSSSRSRAPAAGWSGELGFVPWLMRRTSEGRLRST